MESRSAGSSASWERDLLWAGMRTSQDSWDEGWEGPAPGWEGLAQLQFCSPSVALGRDSTSVSSPLKWGSNSLQCSKGEAVCVCSSLPHPSGDPLATAPHLALA